MMNKKIVFSMLVALPFFAVAQESFTIKGNVGKASAPAKAYLIYSDGGQKIDSALVNNGQFTFTGEISEPRPALLALDVQGEGIRQVDELNRVNLFLEKGDITLAGGDVLSNATLGGTPLNVDQGKLNKSLADIDAKETAFMDKFRLTSEEDRKAEGFMEMMDKQYEAIQLEKEGILLNFIKENPNSLISLKSLMELAGPSPDPVKIEPLLSSLSPQVQQSENAKALGNLLEIAKKVQVGMMAPEFTQNDPDGNPVSLASFKGKYVLIDFWASWCGPCRQENPNLVAAYHKFKDKDFTVFGVSLDRETGRDAWLKAIDDDKLEWTQVSDLKFWENEAAVLYGIRSIPQNYLLDPSGKIIAKDLRGEELHSKLAELLN